MESLVGALYMFWGWEGGVDVEKLIKNRHVYLAICWVQTSSDSIATLLLVYSNRYRDTEKCFCGKMVQKAEFNYVKCLTGREKFKYSSLSASIRAEISSRKNSCYVFVVLEREIRSRKKK